jgi:hypothetical protein
VVAVGKMVEKELKGILQKDINKKLCESYAFLLFDKWWADKVQQFSAIEKSLPYSPSAHDWNNGDRYLVIL